MNYTLLPLRWWEHPWYVGTILCALLCVGLIVGYTVYRIYRKRYRPQTPAERLMMRIELLQAVPCEQPRDVRYAYTELMRIIRDGAQAFFGVGYDGLTDEEFVTLLDHKSEAELPTAFVALALSVSDEACQVKFAAESIAKEQLFVRIAETRTVISFWCSSDRVALLRREQSR